MPRHLLILSLLLLCAILPRAADAQTSGPPPEGSVAGWGNNTWGQIDPATCCNTKQLPINGPAGPWSAIAAGERVTVALRPYGEVWEWGQSGSSDACTLLCLPGPVPGLHDVVSVATSFIDLRLALERDGTVWQWQAARQRAPFQVSGLPPIAQIAVGAWYALALGRDGSVWQWSYSSDPSAAVQPHAVAGLPLVRIIAAGSAHALAATASGDVWTWGAAQNLSTGNPRSTAPVKLAGLENITSVAAGDRFSLALGSDGRVWSWGYNPYGELGHGSSGAGTDTPALIPSLRNITAISAQAFHAMALRSDGTIWTWGANQNSEIGNGTITPYGQGCGCVPAPTPVPGISNALAVAAGAMHDLALLAAPLPAGPPKELSPCGPPPGPVTVHLPLSVPVGEVPSHIAISEQVRRLFLLRPGQYDETTDTYTCTGSLLILDSRTGKPLAAIAVGKAPDDLIADDRANRLFVIDGGARDDALHGDVRVFNERTGRLLATVPLDGAPGNAALAAHAGHLFVTLTDVPSTENHLALAVLGTGAGRLLSLLPLTYPTDRPIVDEATNRLFLHANGTGGSGVIALNASSGRPVGMLTQFLCSGQLYEDAGDRRIIALLPGASHNGEGSLCILDPRTLRVTGGIDYGPNHGAQLLLIDGPAHLLVLDEVAYGPGPPPPGPTLRDARTGRLIRQLTTRVIPAAVDPANGRLIAVARSGQAQILDPRTWRVLRRVPIPTGPVRLTVEQNPHRLLVLSGPASNTTLTLIPL